MKKKKIVLANSVGIDSNELAIIHSPSRWTNSSKDKKVFTYYPWELAYASTLLKRETDHAVKFLDGCLKKYNVQQYFDVIIKENPDILVMEPATRTWEDDRRLALMVKEHCGAQIIMTGQHATANPIEVKKYADHVLIGEYEITLLELLQGKNPQDILGLFPNAKRPLLDIDYLPWPEDEDVSRLDYAYPGEPSSEYVEIQAYATRGCPLNCSYCVCRHVYYAKQNWRPRNPVDIVQELMYLKNKYPEMEGIFFDEEYHNVNKKFILSLTDEIKKQKMEHLKIDAMCAYLTLDREMMEAMKSAGYYMIRFGVETADPEIAKGITLGRKFDIDKLWQVVKWAKELDMKLYGTFTFGAAGSSFERDMKTYDLLKELVDGEYLWRFQTSICTPQPGTPYYEWAQEQGFLSSEKASDYDGGNTAVMNYPHYSNRDIEKVYEKAQDIYDIGLQKRFASGIYQNISQIESSLEGEDKKVLILRTTRSPQLKEAFKAIKEKYPNVKTDVLLQEDFRKEFEAFDLTDDVLVYGNGFFEKETFPESTIEEIRSRNYDLIVIVYANTQGRDYENVMEVVASMKGKRAIAFTARGEIEEIEVGELREAPLQG